MYQQLTDSETQNEKLMIHYNFPGFSVGEASRIGPAGRRELGHGNLAKRAIEPTFDNSDDKTVRIVSEILESNGSSSMATVCAASLALQVAGLDVTNLVAGVAMGMVSDGDKYAILTDINGLEDHDGDMDFKVAGTKEGISALQMDIKLGGISLDVLSQALMQAKEGREHILNIMEEASSDIALNEGVLPSTDHFVVDPSKVADIIGQAGKTIRELIERFDVTIDLDRNKGNVKISGTSLENIEQAKDEIRTITTAVKKEYQVGDEIDAKVKKLVDFGAFVELDRNNDGLLHISKISSERISHPSEVLSEGDEIRVRVSGFKCKKIELERS
jgi:polyribonucleotide nucleotidyltransferase